MRYERKCEWVFFSEHNVVTKWYFFYQTTWFAMTLADFSRSYDLGSFKAVGGQNLQMCCIYSVSQKKSSKVMTFSIFFTNG